MPPKIASKPDDGVLNPQPRKYPPIKLQRDSAEPDDGVKLAPFNPSCEQAQNTALRLLALSSEDILFDLGCGDGRTLLTAVARTPGLRCVGIELDPVFTSRAVESIQKLPSAEDRHRIDIREGDLLKLGYAIRGDGELPQQDSGRKSEDIGTKCRNLTLLEDATAVYLFLLPKGIKKMKPLLDEVVKRRKEEGRPFYVAAYIFSIRGWDPVAVDTTTKGDVPVYLYQFLPDEGKQE